MFVPKGIDGLKDKSGNERTEKGPPKRLERKVIADFFEREQDASNRCAECN